MDIVEIIENLLDSNCTVLAHQVNCIGVMGAGVARQIKNNWPDVYFDYLSKVKALDHNCLGGCLVSQAEENKYVANLFGQYYYSGYFENMEDYLRQDPFKRPAIDKQGNIRFTNYEALHNSIRLLKESMESSNIDSVAFPYGLGCGLGRGSWSIVRSIIEDIFKDTAIRIEIRKIN